MQLVVTAAGSGLLGLLIWSLKRNISSLDASVKSVDDKVGRVETDVRQLSAQGARHGEALAGGVAKFAAIEKRLDGLEDRERIREKECSECQRRWSEGVRG